MDRNRKLKDYELKVLYKLDDLCKKHGLRYYLAYGSALGAARHQGFIPWDDDVDVYMNIVDFIKLKEICEKELEDDFYFQDRSTDRLYYNPWGKLGLENTTWMPKDRLVDAKYGICVDIFPFFPLKDNAANRQYIEKNVKMMNITCSRNYVLKTAKKSVKKFVHRIIPDDLEVKMYEKSLKNLTKFKDDYDKIVLFPMGFHRCVYFNKEDMEGDNKLMFEGRLTPVPNNYDRILTEIYGDYMTPPPVSERFNHDLDNNSVIYDFERSYKYYQNEKD